MILQPFENINLNLNLDATDIAQVTSFRPIIDKITALSEDTPYGAKILAKELLNLIHSPTNIELSHTVEELNAIFEILGHLSGSLKSSCDEYIAFADPIPNKLIYSTSSLQELLASDLEILDLDDSQDYQIITNKILYYHILERFYGINTLEKEYIIESKREGFSQYYELQVDFSYVDIQYEGKLPKLDLKAIKENAYDSMDLLIKALSVVDLTKFKFEGISILHFINRDKEFILRRIQNIIKNFNLKNKKELEIEINDIFKSIIRKNDITYFFLPIFEISGFPISESEYTKESILLGQYLNFSKACNSCSIYSYLSKPIIWTYGIESDLNIDDQIFIDILKSKGITNYLGLPLFHRDRFVGFIEIYASNNNFNKNDALKLKPYLPHFAQLSNDFVAFLKNQLNKIILENYTSIQPALQWRFNEVAVSYLGEMNNEDENSKLRLEKIAFKDVYPIYGAVDIKDSTRIRNLSYKQVLIQHLSYIQELLNNLALRDSTTVFLGFRENIEKIFNCVKDNGVEKNIISIREFLETEIPVLLDQVRSSCLMDDDLTHLIRQIENHNAQIIEPGNDPFEKSLSTLTRAIKEEFDVLNTEIQEIFPSYFETIRTDGIEYDGYIGQSITPTITFKIEMLHQIRKKQILSMVRIIQKTKELSSELPIALRTTQLLFVHPDKISISFREDEKRFDVEGGYNIRYQIIKKRIDKALIENTKERLVQPDTIAIVFSNENITSSIVDNLNEIAAMGLIEKNFEFHTLEELQGVSELRAIRVKVK